MANLKKIELEIIALSHSVSQTHSYAVVLGEVNGLRKFPIVIGAFEAQAISVALERMQPNRPLTHDLMKNFMLAFEINLHEVIINNLQEGIFYSKLVCSSNSDTVEIDSRTSDALALSVRFGCPIYTYEHIIAEVGTVTGNEQYSTEQSKAEAETDSERDKLSEMEIDQLRELLDEVLKEEDYLRAIPIRDELKKREKK